MRHKGWSNSVFIGMFIVSAFFSVPLIFYVLNNPNSFIAKIVLIVSKLNISKGDLTHQIAFGSFFLLLFISLITYVLILIPYEIFGKGFIKSFYGDLFYGYGPGSKATKFISSYNSALRILWDMEHKTYPWFFRIGTKRNDGSFEEINRMLRNYVEINIEEMRRIDPESPFISFIIGKLYGTSIENKPDTLLSAEIKERDSKYRKANRKILKYELSEQRAKSAIINPLNLLIGVFGGLICIVGLLFWLFKIRGVL